MFFSAADLVVLPFSDIMHSGSAILALSFNKPVLVPARGALPELQTRVGAAWVQTYRRRTHAGDTDRGSSVGKKFESQVAAGSVIFRLA